MIEIPDAHVITKSTYVVLVAALIMAAFLAGYIVGWREALDPRAIAAREQAYRAKGGR